jgi:hypothetical protein
VTDDRRINIKAVALGVLTDIGGSLIAILALGVIAGGILAAQGVPEDELDVRLQGPVYLVSSLIVGLGLTVLGGFVAGRVSKKSEVMHGGLVGGVCFVLGLVLWPFLPPLPLWYYVPCYLGTVPSGMLGGRLAVVNRSVRIP